MLISYIHVRRIQDDIIYPKGGLTIAWTIDNNVLSFNMSKCSDLDLYSKSIGRECATNRLKLTPINIPSEFVIDFVQGGLYKHEYKSEINLEYLTFKCIETIIQNFIIENLINYKL